jgi:guanylate kinase
MLTIQRKPMMIAFAAPSGAGKTSLTRRLLSIDANLRLSVSWTTRKMRPAEIDGQDYVFVTQEAFDAKAKAGGFIEHAGVFEKSYGSPRDYVDEAMAEGHDVMFDIDWQGVRQLKAAYPEAVTIFILPPTKAQLSERLMRRGQDDAATVAKRMAQANGEMSHWNEFDYVIVNDFLERSLQDVHAIIIAERLRRDRQPALDAFVAGLMAE